MTNEYLYPNLLNRVSDQGYTNILLEQKRAWLASLWNLSLQVDPWFYTFRTLLHLDSFLCLESLL